MDLGFSFGLMEPNMKENGKTIKPMAEENFGT